MMERQRSKRDKSEEKKVAPPPKLAKIIGGMNAVRGAYPWNVGFIMVYKQYGSTFTFPFCGGTILSEYWMLSAAHCFVKGLKKDDVVVRIGDHDNEVHDDNEQEFKIDVLITHERYSANSDDYDVALIKIRPQNGSGIVFNDYVQPACLPKNNTEYEEGMTCHISGWGTTFKGLNPKILQAAVVPIISDSECIRVYGKEITPRMFCAGYMSGGVDSCLGDSGGPFVCDIQGKYTVIGAISLGDGCAEPNKPGVYAKIKEFLPWIKKKIIH